jgi:hypothetical protein
LGFSCGLAELLLCILPVYLEAPYAFLMKFSYLSKKKKILLCMLHLHLFLFVFIGSHKNMNLPSLSFFVFVIYAVRCIFCYMHGFSVVLLILVFC